jgi:hypothetical protein
MNLGCKTLGKRGVKRCKRVFMKKYLLLIEDEALWERFKNLLNKDINSEIMELIKEKVKEKGGKK